MTPVITLVIHFGVGKWDGPMSLKEMMATTDDRILSYVPDYKINLIEPAQMTSEEMGKFQSTLREVFRFIKFSKDGDKLAEYLQTENRLKSLDVDAAKVIKVATGSKFDIPEGAEVVNVCEAEMELIKKAKEEAQAKAREEERKTIAMSLKEGGMSVETIAKTFKCPVDVVKKWFTPSAV